MAVQQQQRFLQEDAKKDKRNDLGFSQILSLPCPSSTNSGLFDLFSLKNKSPLIICTEVLTLSQ